MHSKVLMVVIVSIIICAFILMVGENVFAKCEAALKRLRAAEAELNAANAAYNAAKQALANLNAAAANLNAVAGKLGAAGKATTDGATFGRSPSNPSFFENQEYKTAKQAWQDAKDAYGKTGGIDAAGARRMRAQGEYDEAKAEYERLRAEHIGDAGYLKKPEGPRIDESLSKEVERVIGNEKSHTTIKQDDTYFDISFNLKKSKDKTILETCVISKGKEARHRKWIPKNPGLIVGSTAIDPVEAHDYYITQVSKEPARRTAAAGVSSSVVTALGRQYTGGVKEPTHYKGAACPTGVSQESGKTKSWGSTIGGAGMATGLGLLTSQRATRDRITKEKVKGLKSSFDVTGHEDNLEGAKFKTDLVNETGGNVVEIVVPVRFYKQGVKGDAGEKCPYYYCSGNINYTEYSWVYKSHEEAKEVKRQNVGKKDKVTYSAKVKFDVTKTTVYWEKFKCTLPKHVGDHEGGIVKESCEKVEKYTETREYKRDVLVDKGASKPPTNEDITKWAEQEAKNRSS